MLVVSGKKLRAEVDEVLGDISVSYALQQVAQMTINLTDTGGVMNRDDLARFGTQVSGAGQTGLWEVGGLGQSNLGDDTVAWTVAARSALARQLRKRQSGGVSGIRSTQWVTNRVKTAGGVAICQPSQRKAKLDKEADRTILDTIDALSADLGWSWAEYDGRLIFMDPHYAWKTYLGLPMWPITWGHDAATDALAADTQLEDDDTASFGSGTLQLPHTYGRRLRPYHVVDLAKGFGGPRAGTWLVTGVDYVANRPEQPAAVQISRPRKGIPQQRTGAAGGSGIGSLGDAEWIDGADRVWPKCTRTPRQAVQFGLNNLGPSWYGNGNCLAWVSVAFKGSQGLGGELAYYVWDRASASAIKSPGDMNPPAGAVVVWKPESMGGHGGRAGHVGISIGGGKFVSATSGAIRIDRIAGGWARGYYGAMTPSF